MQFQKSRLSHPGWRTIIRWTREAERNQTALLYGIQACESYLHFQGRQTAEQIGLDRRKRKRRSPPFKPLNPRQTQQDAPQRLRPAHGIDAQCSATQRARLPASQPASLSLHPDPDPHPPIHRLSKIQYKTRQYSPPHHAPHRLPHPKPTNPPVKAGPNTPATHPSPHVLGQTGLEAERRAAPKSHVETRPGASLWQTPKREIEVEGGFLTSSSRDHLCC